MQKYLIRKNFSIAIEMKKVDPQSLIWFLQIDEASTNGIYEWNLDEGSFEEIISNWIQLRTDFEQISSYAILSYPFEDYFVEWTDSFLTFIVTLQDFIER